MTIRNWKYWLIKSLAVDDIIYPNGFNIRYLDLIKCHEADL